MDTPRGLINPDFTRPHKCLRRPAVAGRTRLAPAPRSPRRCLLVVRHPQRRHPAREKQRRPDDPQRIDRHMVVRNRPPHCRALHRDHPPCHTQEPAFEPREIIEGMEFRVHGATLHPLARPRCARLGQRRASLAGHYDPPHFSFHSHFYSRALTSSSSLPACAPAPPCGRSRRPSRRNRAPSSARVRRK